MSYVIKAVLSNAAHPGYGEATIPFPIPDNQYDQTMELLKAAGMGDVLAQDCRVGELDSFYSVLNRLVGSTVNVDGKKICKKSPTWNEADIHASVAAAMNELFHAQTAKEALEASITATLAGENGERSLPALEAEIRRMQERQMELFQMAVSAGSDSLDYDEEIQRVNMAKTSLMAKKAELEREGWTAAAFEQRMEDIVSQLEQASGAIMAFDEVTVRQMVSNIKVISKDILMICFKDGTEIILWTRRRKTM